MTLALWGCDYPARLAQADAGDAGATRQVELIETHSIARSGVTLGGPVLGPGEAARSAAERPYAWSEAEPRDHRL